MPEPQLTALPQIPDQARHWGQLYVSARSLAIAEYAANHQELVVVIVPGMHELVQLEAEIRFYADPALPLTTFTDWETLPYDLISPHQDIISERIRSLYLLPQTHRGILLVAASGLMQRLTPRSFLEQYALIIKAGDRLTPEDFRERLVDGGYRHVTQVEEHGEFAVRGSIIDLFPMASSKPFRVDFFDDEIDSIRAFDPETQLTVEKHEQLELLPAHEFPLNADGIKKFRHSFRNTFDAASKNCSLYRSVSDGNAPAGIEYYTPLFFEHMATLFDYLPEQCHFLQLEGSRPAMENFWQSVQDRYEERRHDIERPILPPPDLYNPPEQTLAELQRHRL
ncbi:MAG: transcription-repair coupling factor, partial [Gammaproteobacteria bacterium]|nr:transcription-repair coupling factor [Gammaproteobacteria bacterium]